MKPRKPARIIPCTNTKPGHEPWGWIVHPDDRAARRLPKPKAKQTEEEPKDGE